MRKILSRPVRILLGAASLILLLDLMGIHMFKTPLYISEARQPASFPRPGKIGQIKLKSYPEYRAAVVRNATLPDSQMFRRLFQHIKRNKIAMTAPVEMTFDENGQESMSFLYADPSLGEAGWDGDVEVIDVPSTSVVSIAIRGSYKKSRFDEAVVRLQSWLDKHPDWRATAKPRYLGFNSPFVPGFFRLGEIQVPVERRRPS